MYKLKIGDIVTSIAELNDDPKNHWIAKIVSINRSHATLSLIKDYKGISCGYEFNWTLHSLVILSSKTKKSHYPAWF